MWMVAIWKAAFGFLYLVLHTRVDFNTGDCAKQKFWLYIQNFSECFHFLVAHNLLDAGKKKVPTPSVFWSYMLDSCENLGFVSKYASRATVVGIAVAFYALSLPFCVHILKVAFSLRCVNTFGEKQLL
jgi:hypothetical protein